MPEKETLERAREDEREGKSPSTQAGEFVREEIHHVREGKHGVTSSQQAIAIGLSKARRAGVKLPAPGGDGVSAATRKKAASDSREGQSGSHHRVSGKRSRATTQVLKKKGRSAASRSALSKQAKSVAKRRGPAARHEAAIKASRTRKAA
jgi:hypothetical protein